MPSRTFLFQVRASSARHPTSDRRQHRPDLLRPVPVRPRDAEPDVEHRRQAVHLQTRRGRVDPAELPSPPHPLVVERRAPVDAPERVPG